jgi:hypothetical protein
MARVVRNRNFKREMNTPAAARDWQELTARLGEQTIAALAPVDTGQLRQRIEADRSTSEASVRFRAPTDSEAPYALFQEVGTGIYGPLGRYITPKRAAMLSWVDRSGDRVFAKRVRGVRPQHYFKRGLEYLFGQRNVRYYGDAGGKGTGQG